MSLYKRLHEANEDESTGTSTAAGGGAQASGRRDPAMDELRHRVHSSLIEELGPILYDKPAFRGGPPQEGPRGSCTGASPSSGLRCRPSDKAQLIQDVSDDILGYGPDRPAAARRRRLGNHVQRPRVRLRGTVRQAHPKDRSPSSTSCTCAASSTRSSARSAVASTSRPRCVTPVLPDGSRVNAVISPLTVGGPFLTIRKFAADPLQDRRPDPLRHAGARNSARFLQACCRRQAERDRLRRYRYR